MSYNWWAEGREENEGIVAERVRYYLGIYRQIEENLNKVGATWDKEGRIKALGGKGGTLEEWICIKVDLDRALEHCTGRQQTALRLMYRHGLNQYLIAGVLRVSQAAISKLITRAISSMAKFLVKGGYQKAQDVIY